MRLGFAKYPLEFENLVWPGKRVPRPKRARRHCRTPKKLCVVETRALGQDSFPVAELQVVNGMIVLPYREGSSSVDPRQRAGAAAERQMAHYLHRTFSDDASACVLHGLRIKDPDQPEQNGAPGVCQIDHLLVHRWGLFIVESKSVSQEVRVRPDGTGGDEWSRVWNGSESGMPSPIRQARRQAELLRGLLQRYRADLLGRKALGQRTLAKLITGCDQRGFKHIPMQLVIAVSDRGTIKRLDGWTEPQKPFQVYVAKADLVPDKISGEIKRHRKGARITSINPLNEYGLWDMKKAEVVSVAEFLADRHSDQANPPSSSSSQPPKAPARKAPSENLAQQANPSSQPSCKHCGSNALTARWGRFGYYWRCGECGKNTKMPVACAACSAEGSHGNTVVKIRKTGAKYFRDCVACGASELIWIAP